jgi:hypothetical protein
MSSENYLNDEKNISINFMKSNYTNINVSKNELLSNTHCYTLLFQTTSYKKSYYGQHNLFTVIKMAREWYVGYLLNTRREDGFIC